MKSHGPARKYGFKVGRTQESPSPINHREPPNNLQSDYYIPRTPLNVFMSNNDFQ